MREEREQLQDTGRGPVEPTACHPYTGDGERRPRDGRRLPLSGVARVEMATGTQNPSTRRVLPDKEAGMG
jgi:hypothetical protein